MRTEAGKAHIVDDMERIFAPLADRPVPPPQSRSRSTGRGRLRFVLPTLIAFVGGGAFAVAYGLGTVPPVQPPNRPPTRAATPLPMPDRQLATKDEGGVAGPAKATEIAALSAAATPSPIMAPAETTDPLESSLRPDWREDESVAQDSIARPQERRCRPGSPEDHCIYRDVMNADARLRRAYERAADAGVSSSWLASVNRRWERARGYSQDDPDQAIDRYDRLADALDNERDDLR